MDLFCHVFNNTRGLKLAKNVIRAIFVVGISFPNREVSWILIFLLKIKLFVTNLLRFTTPKHRFDDKYYECMTNTSQFMELHNIEI